MASVAATKNWCQSEPASLTYAKAGALVAFSILFQFNSVVTIGSSGAPLAFIVAMLLILARTTTMVGGGRPLDYRIDSHVAIFGAYLLLVLLAAPLTFHRGSEVEVFIRLGHYVAALAVFYYATMGFFISGSILRPIKIIILSQIPSLTFGVLEVAANVIDGAPGGSFESMLLVVRRVTNYIETDPTALGIVGRGMVLFFFESSQSIYYFVCMAFLFSICVILDRNVLRQGWFVGYLTVFSVLFLFHRSGTLLLLLAASAFYLLVVAKARLMAKLAAFILVAGLGILYVMFFNDLLLKRVLLLGAGTPDISFLLRTSAILRGIVDLVDTSFLGYGFGQYSITTQKSFQSIYDLIAGINLDFANLLLGEPRLRAVVLYGDVGGRHPFYSVYFGMMSEQGWLAIALIIALHIRPFLRSRNPVLKYWYFLTFVILSWGVPMAFAFPWLMLGILRRLSTEGEVASPQRRA